MSEGEELTARPRISAFATTLQFSTDRHANSHVTGNSNEAEIMKTQDNDSETNHAEKSSRVTSVLRSNNRMDSASNDNTKAIDSFFAESSADINFRNLA